jgi:hypothetical protein
MIVQIPISWGGKVRYVRKPLTTTPPVFSNHLKQFFIKRQQSTAVSPKEYTLNFRKNAAPFSRTMPKRSLQGLHV